MIMLMKLMIFSSYFITSIMSNSGFKTTCIFKSIFFQFRFDINDGVEDDQEYGGEYSVLWNKIGYRLRLWKIILLST